MSWKQAAYHQEVHKDGSDGYVLQTDVRKGDFSHWAGQVQCVYLDPPFMTG